MFTHAGWSNTGLSTAPPTAAPMPKHNVTLFGRQTEGQEVSATTARATDQIKTHRGACLDNPHIGLDLSIADECNVFSESAPSLT